MGQNRGSDERTPGPADHLTLRTAWHARGVADPFEEVDAVYQAIGRIERRLPWPSPATPGWDPVTGLGTPNAGNLKTAPSGAAGDR
jgi:hypothetical protein